MFDGFVPLIKPNNGCDYHRLSQPLKYMGFDFDAFEKKIIAIPGKRPQYDLKEIRIIFFNRLPMDPVGSVLEAKKKYGYKMIVDLDDHWDVDVKHLMYEGNKAEKDRFNWGEKQSTIIKAADAVIVTTDRLADKIRDLNNNIHVIPNALPYEEEQFTSTRFRSDEMRFMYACGVAHRWDVRELINGFKKLNHERLPAKYILAGFEDKNAGSLKVWNQIESSFSLSGTLKGYERRGTLPLTEYMNHLSNADVSLAPLETNPFTQFKSNLKVLEAGCKNIPIITSNTPPYSDEPNRTIYLNKGIMLAHNARSWYDHIKYCIKNPSFVEEKGYELGAYVRKHYDLRKVNEHRAQLFKHINS